MIFLSYYTLGTILEVKIIATNCIGKSSPPCGAGILVAIEHLKHI